MCSHLLFETLTEWVLPLSPAKALQTRQSTAELVASTGSLGPGQLGTVGSGTYSCLFLIKSLRCKSSLGPGRVSCARAWPLL